MVSLGYHVSKAHSLLTSLQAFHSLIHLKPYCSLESLTLPILALLMIFFINYHFQNVLYVTNFLHFGVNIFIHGIVSISFKCSILSIYFESSLFYSCILYLWLSSIGTESCEVWVCFSETLHLHELKAVWCLINVSQLNN